MKDGCCLQCSQSAPAPPAEVHVVAGLVLPPVDANHVPLFIVELIFESNETMKKRFWFCAISFADPDTVLNYYIVSLGTWLDVLLGQLQADLQCPGACTVPRGRACNVPQPPHRIGV